MILGFDASSILESRACDSHYYVEGKEIDPITYSHDVNGVDLMRLRIWVDPYDENGTPYAGGTCDLPSVIKMAKEGVEKGYKILLDFHYSDFWCDPGKQFLPKSWEHLSLTQLIEKLYEYTSETLKSLQKEGICPHSIQVGNEITNGMLWPYGKLIYMGEDVIRGNYDALIMLLKAGVKACREVCPDAKIVIHLEKSADKKIYKEFFDEMLVGGLDFDIIGLSFYPYWHGTFDMVFENIDMLKARYHKPIWIVETAYGFSLEKAYDQGEEFIPWINEESYNKIEIYKPFPLTKEGQKDFVRELLRECEDHGVDAIVWWEPFWVPKKGLMWASKCGEEYVHETHKPTNDEWANQCLFDYDGNANPAFFEYRK